MPGPEPWLNLVAVGDSAVTGFFVLSGFFHAKTCLLPNGTMKGTCKAFWSARFARIYPIYALSLILVAQACLTTAPRTVPEVLWAAGTAVTLTQAWWPETSLAINQLRRLVPLRRSLSLSRLPRSGPGHPRPRPCRSRRRLFAATKMALADRPLNRGNRRRSRMGRNLGRALIAALRRPRHGPGRPRRMARHQANGPSR